MVGVVVILVVLALVGPVALFVAGALWSATFGWLASAEADLRAEA